MSDLDVLLTGGENAIEALVVAQSALVSEVNKASATLAEAVSTPPIVSESAVEAASVSQVAEVVSCSSVPGYWSIQLRYVNDAGQAVVRGIYVGANPVDSEYSLWQSKQHFVEATFDDYSGTVLVPCPEVVSV